MTGVGPVHGRELIHGSTVLGGAGRHVPTPRVDVVSAPGLHASPGVRE